MSDKDQSAISKEKETDNKKNIITNEYQEKKQLLDGKESKFISFFALIFIIDLIFVIVADFSIIDFVIDGDFCFSKSFSESQLGMFTKIFVFGAVIGLFLIFLRNAFDFFSKKK